MHAMWVNSFVFMGTSDGVEREESASLNAQPWPRKVFEKGRLVEVQSLSNNCMYVIILYFIKFVVKQGNQAISFHS